MSSAGDVVVVDIVLRRLMMMMTAGRLGRAHHAYHRFDAAVRRASAPHPGHSIRHRRQSRSWAAVQNPVAVDWGLSQSTDQQRDTGQAGRSRSGAGHRLETTWLL